MRDWHTISASGSSRPFRSFPHHMPQGTLYEFGTFSVQFEFQKEARPDANYKRGIPPPSPLNERPANDAFAQ